MAIFDLENQFGKQQAKFLGEKRIHSLYSGSQMCDE